VFAAKRETYQCDTEDKKSVLSRDGPRDAAVDFGTYIASLVYIGIALFSVR